MVRASRRSGANSKRMVHWSTWSTNLECSDNGLYVLGYVAYRDVLQIWAESTARLTHSVPNFLAIDLSPISTHPGCAINPASPIAFLLCDPMPARVLFLHNRLAD